MIRPRTGAAALRTSAKVQDFVKSLEGTSWAASSISGDAAQEDYDLVQRLIHSKWALQAYILNGSRHYDDNSVIRVILRPFYDKPLTEAVIVM
jgi:hypothetical protein